MVSYYTSSSLMQAVVIQHPSNQIEDLQKQLWEERQLAEHERRERREFRKLMTNHLGSRSHEQQGKKE